jgi:sterol desaturase/sphingolipid hydroxylase (fatty acid hydroxylase superfamily)
MSSIAAALSHFAHTPAAHTPATWLFVFVVVMVIGEAAARRRSGRRADRAETVTSLKLGLLYFLVREVAGQALFLGVAVTVYERWRLFTIPTHNPAAWVGVYLAGDLLYYGVHRAEHRSRLLWASHLVHHSATDYSFTTAVRNPWTEVLYKPVLGMLAPLLGVNPLGYAVIATTRLMVGLLQHTDMVGRLGPLDAVFMTPSNHRVHHASNAEYLDHNFGGTFVIWDRLFRTYVPETTTPVFGITKPLPSNRASVVAAGGFPALWADLRSATGWRTRLAIATARP